MGECPDASGILSKRVFRGRECPGARAATQIGVLAPTTASREGGIADRMQQRMVSIDLYDASFPDISES
jgi:hypothetical protein